jgi:hypothetical protein
VSRRRRAVDLAAVRLARERLDELVRAHPELRGERSAANVAGWQETLEHLDAPKGDTHAMADPTQQVAFRLPVSLLERLDAYADRMRDAQPGLTVTRADVVRVLLARALDADEAAAKPKRAKR